MSRSQYTHQNSHATSPELTSARITDQPQQKSDPPKTPLNGNRSLTEGKTPRMIAAQRQATREYDLGEHILIIDRSLMRLVLANKPTAGRVPQEIQLDGQELSRLHNILLPLFAR